MRKPKDSTWQIICIIFFHILLDFFELVLFYVTFLFPPSSALEFFTEMFPGIYKSLWKVCENCFAVCI